MYILDLSIMGAFLAFLSKKKKNTGGLNDTKCLSPYAL